VLPDSDPELDSSEPDEEPSSSSDLYFLGSTRDTGGGVGTGGSGDSVPGCRIGADAILNLRFFVGAEPLVLFVLFVLLEEVGVVAAAEELLAIGVPGNCKFVGKLGEATT
jgi:hypothetical protein